MTHNHQHCIDTALATANAICHQRKLRFTAIRQQVLKLVWSNHQPVGAYRILEQLNTANTVPAPPTVYRALDFLLENGFIHRITSLNAFVGCSHAKTTHASQFLICEQCGNATELRDKQINSSIYRAAQQLGFTAKQQVLELLGTCQQCQV